MSPPTRKRNRKRKRRVASSSSSSEDSSSEPEEQCLKSAQKPADVSEESPASTSSSDSESDSDSETSNSPVKQPPQPSKMRDIRASPSPSPPPATLPSFISSEGDGDDSQRNKEMQERFRKFWMASVADGFREDLEVIQKVCSESSVLSEVLMETKEPNMNTTKLAMLIDSLASGADVFTSNGVHEIGVVLE